jgi:hypothetical protein
MKMLPCDVCNITPDRCFGFQTNDENFKLNKLFLWICCTCCDYQISHELPYTATKMPPYTSVIQLLRELTEKWNEEMQNGRPD